MQNDAAVPGFTADPDLQAKLDNLDDHLEPVEEKEKNEQTESEEEPKEAEENEEASEEESSEEQAEDSTDTEADEEVSDADGEEGYTIDGDEEPEEKPVEADNAPDKSQLTPEQQFILDGISPLIVKGYVGDSTELQEFKVYSPEQLPDGFKYPDDKSLSIATKGFGLLEEKAAELQTEFRNQETAKSTKAFKEAEDNADRADIGRLQREGELPKFKVQPDDPKFEEDPAAKLIQEVLDFKEKRNAQYLEEYNAGRPFKHIGFEEAYMMYQRSNPKVEDSAQSKEDSERKEVAKHTSGTKGSRDTVKSRIHSGMDSMALEQLIEARTAGWS